MKGVYGMSGDGVRDGEMTRPATRSGAYGANVRGIEPAKTGMPLNNYDLKRMWIA